MSMLKLMFSGTIKKVEFRQAGDTPLVELSLCRKNYAKPGEDVHFTWIKATVFKPPEWMPAKLVKGAHVSGCGEFTLRSYVDKTGQKGVSAEVRCGSFDLDVAGDESGAATAAVPVKAEPRRPAATPSAIDLDEPPF